MLTTYSRPRSASPVPFLALFGLVFLVVVLQMLRSLPEIVATASLPPTTTLGDSRPLPWPSTGAAMVAVKGLGPIGSYNDTAPRPIASVTKVMTAYVILKNHPLSSGEKGPIYTVTAADLAGYLSDAAQDQSVVGVSRGEQFSEYEMLQALLVPSANNFAEMLAAWDAGSVAAFVTTMNTEAANLGMRNTVYADPSGFSAASKSTAADQLILAEQAMANPVFAEIVAQPSARLPGAGVVSNVNTLLGQEGVAGIKTGFTEDAGDCLVFYAKRQVNGQPVDLFGIVLGQSSRPALFDSSRGLVSAAGNALQSVRVVSKDQVVATLKPRWGKAVQVVAAQDASMLLWPGMTLMTSVQIGEVSAPLGPGVEVGRLNLKLGDQQVVVPLKVATPLNKPSFVWRLTRI